MKIKPLIHLTLYTFFLAGIASCSSNEEKADIMVDNFMKRHLHDPSSYILIEYSHLDSLHSSFEATDEAAYMIDKMKQITDSAAFYADKVSTVYKAQKLIDDGQRILKAYKKKKAAFNSQFLGFTKTIKFRAKNDKGVWIRSYVTFRISPDYKRITIEDGDITILDLFGADVIKNNMAKD